MTNKAHPKTDQLSDYALGLLPAEELQTVADHIHDCLECQETLSNLADPSDTLILGLRGKAPDEAYPDEPEYEKALAAVQEFGHTPPPDMTYDGSGSLTDIIPGDRDLGTLRDYQLLAKLGQGGMGTVYKARHLKLDRLVALKVLPSDRMKDEQLVARFHREMKAVGSLDHPNIVRAHDAGEANDKHFLVMELVDGIDISALVRQQGRLPIADACELIRQAAVGLEHAHEHGLVHRDVKPSNLMLASGGGVKVLDLGLARLLSEAADEESRDDALKESSGALHAELAEADDFQAIGDELTGTDQVMGTPDYMAPEQCTDAHRVDIRSDIYSLGATLYKLLTGHAPYTGKQFDSLAKKIIGLTSQPVPAITEQRDDLPDELVAVIGRMLAKEPADRYLTPAEVARALSPYSEGHNVARFVDTSATPKSDAMVATPPSGARSTRHRDRKAIAGAPPRRVWPWILTAGAAGAVIFGVILLQLRTPHGLLTVEVPEEARDTVQVEVRSGDKVEVADKQCGWKIRLTSGTWEVLLNDPSDRFELDNDEVVITRDGTQLVKVMLKSTQRPPKQVVSTAGENRVATKDQPSVEATPPEATLASAGRDKTVASSSITGVSASSATAAEKRVAKTPPTEDVRAYAHIRVADLTLIDGELPTYSQEGGQNRANGWRNQRPYAVLDGSGEVYLRGDVNPLPSRRQNVGPLRLVLHVPEPRTVTGRLFVPKPDFSSMVALNFRIEKEKLGKESQRNFWEAKRDHYQELVRRDIPGAAWFRYQVAEAQRALGVSQDAVRNDSRRRTQNRNTDSMRSFEMLSGGLAISENLQLDRILPTTAPASETVSIDAINGIMVREFDWTELAKELDPKLDPLAQLIPDDQHALFFSSFPAMASAVDHAYMAGTPVLRVFEPRGEDAQTFSRYQTQLGLPLSALARKLGPQFVKSVAVTGGDPYLRTGTDMAILFEPKDCTELQMLLDAQISLAASENSKAKTSETMLGKIKVRSVESLDRSICSYRAMLGDAIVVTNSRKQLERIVSTFRSEEKSLAALSEYKFFRDRYARGDTDETGLLVISDKTIRRWCGPRWRIGASRRLRAAAVMADVQAEHLMDMLADEPSFVSSIVTKHHRVAGRLAVSPCGVHSPTYGTPKFLTPIIELDLDKVTRAEANMYTRWRDGYQRNWSRFFDPIAVRFTAHKDKLLADVTVMPLIDNSRYREMIDISLGAKIDPAAADPHPESIVHASMSLNKDSPRVKNSTSFAMQLAPQIKIDPLAWIGTTVSLYADKDPFWEDIAQKNKSYLSLFQEVHRLPIAMHVEVIDGFRLVGFLASARAYIEQTAPGMTVWEIRKHGDEPYVRIGPSERAKSRWGLLSNLSVYYAATGESLIISLTEPVLHRALDRLAARRQAKADGKPTASPQRPWLGDNFGVRMDGEFVHAIEALFQEEFDREMQRMSWGNLPILNEWKRRFPERDPVELHQQFWHRRLVCPAGGTYRWNDQWQTMESTVYGSSGQPTESAKKPPSPLDNIASGEFGLTFKENGLRARMVLTNKEFERESNIAE